MFKRSLITKKVAVGILATLTLGSFLPAYSITWKEVGQLTNECGNHITEVLLGVTLVVGGCIPFSRKSGFVEKTFGILAGVTGVAFSTISFKQLKKDLEKLRKKNEPNNKVEKVINTVTNALTDIKEVVTQS